MSDSKTSLIATTVAEPSPALAAAISTTTQTTADDNAKHEDDHALNNGSTSTTSASKSSRQRRVWTAEEDARLRLLVSYWGDQCGKNGHWDKISAHFDHRSNKDCRKRWFHSLDPKLKRGRWTEHEDKVLVEAFDKMGPVWHRIAQLIPGRTDDQCSKRYNDVLDPSISDRLRTWSPEEDKLLLNLVSKLGTQWRKIANEMEGRTGLTCRNRWRKISSGTKPARRRDEPKQAESAGISKSGQLQPPTRNIQPAAVASSSSSSALPAAPSSSSATLPQGLGLPFKDDSSPISLASMESPGSSTASKRSPVDSVISSSSAAARSIPSSTSNNSRTRQSQLIPPPLEPADSTTTSTHYTFTVDPESKEHHSVTPTELEQLILLAKTHGAPIIVHQHNYHHHHYLNGMSPQVAALPSQQQQPKYHAVNSPFPSHSTTHIGSSSSGKGLMLDNNNTIQGAKTPQLGPTTTVPRSGESSLPMSNAPTPGLFAEIMALGEPMIPEFADDDLGLDFDAFDGIPFNPS